MSLNSSFAPPDETSSDIWVEVSTFMGDAVLGSVAFGILVCLYAFCLSVLIPQVKVRQHRRWAIIHLVYTSLMVVLIGIGTATNIRYAQIAWINNRNIPGGPLAFITQEGSLTILTLGWSAFIVASWMQDIYVIYRCVIFWDRNYLVCGLPILCLVGSVSASIALIVEIALPNNGIGASVSLDLGETWYVLSVAINLYVTIAIVGRLLWKRKTIVAVLGPVNSKVYTGIITMLVESAALYSIFGIIFLAVYFQENPLTSLILPILGTLEGICPLMVIYRVSSGRGWTEQTSRQLSTLVANSTPSKSAEDMVMGLGNLDAISPDGTGLHSQLQTVTGSVGMRKAYTESKGSVQSV